MAQVSPWQSPGYSNPNLLKNWDFRQVVNQRGQTEYTQAGITIDMWDASNGNTTVLLQNGELQSITFTGMGYFAQRIENRKALIGKTVTFSVYAENVNGQISLSEVNKFATESSHNDITVTNGITTHTFVVDDADIMGGVTFWSPGEASFKPIAAKLEVGTVSTLAIDLLQPPNYAAQLRECQRYLQVADYHTTSHMSGYGISNSTTDAELIIPLAVPMRLTKPTISDTDGSKWRIICGGTAITPTDVSIWFASDWEIGLKFTGIFPYANKACVGVYNDRQKFLISAEL